MIKKSPLTDGNPSGLFSTRQKDYSMAIYKAKVQSEFAQIPNSTAQDSRLSFEARGLLVMILSMPDTWVIHKEWLIKQSPKCGRDKMTRLLKELIDLGYMIKKPKHENGQLNGVDWLVYADPHSVELKNRRTEYLSDCKSNTIKETSLERNSNTKKHTDISHSDEYSVFSIDELCKEDFKNCHEIMPYLEIINNLPRNQRYYTGKLTIKEWSDCEDAMRSVDSFDHIDYVTWWTNTRHSSFNKTPSLPNMLCEVNGIPFDQFYDSTFMQEVE